METLAQDLRFALRSLRKNPVEAREPWIYLAVIALLGVVALFASLVPARRAGRVDPAAALRFD